MPVLLAIFQHSEIMTKSAAGAFLAGILLTIIQAEEEFARDGGCSVPHSFLVMRMVGCSTLVMRRDF